jgi:hypothetical protein
MKKYQALDHDENIHAGACMQDLGKLENTNF